MGSWGYFPTQSDQTLDCYTRIGNAASKELDKIWKSSHLDNHIKHPESSWQYIGMVLKCLEGDLSIKEKHIKNSKKIISWMLEVLWATGKKNQVDLVSEFGKYTESWIKSWSSKDKLRSALVEILAFLEQGSEVSFAAMDVKGRTQHIKLM